MSVYFPLFLAVFGPFAAIRVIDYFMNATTSPQHVQRQVLQ